MTTERQRGNAPGPTSSTVADNLIRVRRHRGLSLRELADRLAELGWPMSWSALGKIENRARKVDVDDLMALSVALDVSPLGLLLPRVADEGDVVEVTGMNGPAVFLWAWSVGRSSWRDETVDMTGRRTYPDDIADVSLPRWLDLLAITRRLPYPGESEGRGDG